IQKLLEEGVLVRSLFDRVNLAEITAPDYPGERLIVCYNPLLAERRRDKRHRLLQATEDSLRKLVAEVGRRTKKPLTAVQIGVKAERSSVATRWPSISNSALRMVRSPGRGTKRRSSARSNWTGFM